MLGKWVHGLYLRDARTKRGFKRTIAHILQNAEGVQIGMVLKVQGTRTYKHKYAGYVHFYQMGMLPVCIIGAKSGTGKTALRNAKSIVHARCNNYNLPYNG